MKNYALCTIYLTLIMLQLKDTTAEADGDRNLINVIVNIQVLGAIQ